MVPVDFNALSKKNTAMWWEKMVYQSWNTNFSMEYRNSCVSNAIYSRSEVNPTGRQSTSHPWGPSGNGPVPLNRSALIFSHSHRERQKILLHRSRFGSLQSVRFNLEMPQSINTHMLILFFNSPPKNNMASPSHSGQFFLPGPLGTAPRKRRAARYGTGRTTSRSGLRSVFFLCFNLLSSCWQMKWNRTKRFGVRYRARLAPRGRAEELSVPSDHLNFSLDFSYLDQKISTFFIYFFLEFSRKFRKFEEKKAEKKVEIFWSKYEDKLRWSLITENYLVRACAEPLILREADL